MDAFRTFTIWKIRMVEIRAANISMSCQICTLVLFEEAFQCISTPHTYVDYYCTPFPFYSLIKCIRCFLCCRLAATSFIFTLDTCHVCLSCLYNIYSPIRCNTCPSIPGTSRNSTVVGGDTNRRRKNEKKKKNTKHMWSLHVVVCTNKKLASRANFFRRLFIAYGRRKRNRFLRTKIQNKFVGKTTNTKWINNKERERERSVSFNLRQTAWLCERNKENK